MSIIDVIERIRREPPYADPDSIFPDKRYVCTVLDPVPWDRRGLEQTLGFEIPPELATLWDACGGLTLYEDDMFHQWGLVVCPPSASEIFTLNNRYHKAWSWANIILPGDFIFAEFLGDLELGLIRCDKNAADYGSITIVAEMDPRPHWAKAGGSIEEFLLRFMESRVRKFWSYHYQKELAEKAAQALLRAKRQN